MRIAVLGTGVVGQTLGRKLVELGHEVTMGSRQAGNEKAVAWVATLGEGRQEPGTRPPRGRSPTPPPPPSMVVNATSGEGSLPALDAAGADNLAGKVVIDVSNPLDFSHGMPPSLSVCNTDSLAEQIQRRFPEARVVKSLNTVNADVMVNPGIVPGSHTIFMAGDDAAAKVDVRGILESFGWPPGDILDLGDVTAARGLEMYLPLWLRLWGATGTGHLNIQVRHAAP